jgi:hypothetical protein
MSLPSIGLPTSELPVQKKDHPDKKLVAEPDKLDNDSRK